MLGFKRRREQFHVIFLLTSQNAFRLPKEKAYCKISQTFAFVQQVH